MIKHLAFTLAFLTAASTVAAQGALTTQGLGFPPGQMSARAEGSGGSSADFDPLSAISPASIAGSGIASLFLQYSPEFRRVTAGDASATTTTARFPLFGAIIPAGESWTIGLGASTFLDRSFETSAQRRDRIGDMLDSVDVTERLRVLGAINDLRLVLARATGSKFRIGVGGHVFTGSNRVRLGEFYPDSAGLISNSQESVVSFFGFAGSIGLQFHPSRTVGFSLSARKGAELRANSGDTAVATANIPDRVSAGIMFDGITGATLSARVSRETWSSLAGLLSDREAADTWDASVGAEVSGPRVMQRIVMLRAGARYRTLPFNYNGAEVKETAFSAGFGAPLTRNRATFDFALQRAMRTTGGDVKERGYILSFGLRVSP